MNIGPNILRFRRQKGMSLVDLARRLDTHPSNVKRWETGRVSPRWETVVRIAEALEVPVEDLAAGEDTRHPGRLASPIAAEGLSVSTGGPSYALMDLGAEEAEEPEDVDALQMQTARLAVSHERRAKEYRALTRFLRHPRFRALREVIAGLPEDLSVEEVGALAGLLTEAVRRRAD